MLRLAIIADLCKMLRKSFHPNEFCKGKAQTDSQAIETKFAGSPITHLASTGSDLRPIHRPLKHLGQLLGPKIAGKAAQTSGRFTGH